jgi:putative aldouronate transport system substrate-binding protein
MKLTKIKLKTTGVSVSIALLAVSALAGCSGEQAKQKSSVGQDGAKGPLELSIMNIYYVAEAPKTENDVKKKIEEYTNTKLSINWVPSAAYTDKINAVLASGDLPKVTLIDNNKAPSIVNALESGLFWEVGPYLKDYPNLSKMNPAVLNNISINGKIYGIYRYRPFLRNGIIYRKDWLDNLGMKEPKTTDDFYAMLKAFTTDDPDKDGKNNTFGMTVPKSVDVFDTLMVYFGGPSGWEIKDGKLIPGFMTKEYMDTLKFMKKLYDEKLINQDFAILPSTYEHINSNKAGVSIGGMDGAYNGTYADLMKSNPKAQLDIIGRLTGPKGDKHVASTGYNSTYMFPKSSVKSEAELKQILTYFDKMLDPKMQDLWAWGIEGKHYKMENGKPVRTNQQLYADELNSNGFGQLRLDDGSQVMQGEDPPVVKKFKQIAKDDIPIAVTNPTIPLISKTMSEKGNELDKIINDARVKFIMGAMDEAGFLKEVDNWNKTGGEKVIAEFNEAFALQQKK